MRALAVIAGLVGLALFSGLVAYSGFGDVVGAVAEAGWAATALVVLARAAALVVDGVAWRLLFPPELTLSTAVAIFLRCVREGINQLLPVASVGGDFIGARLATFWRCDGALAAASTVADVAVQAATQFLFAICGLAILVYLQGDGDLVRYAAMGLAAAALGIGAFLALQGRGGSRLVGGLLRRLAGGRDWAATSMVDRLWAQLGRIYASPGRIALSTALHLAVWFFGAVEVYVALHFMGYPISFAEAIVIESLGQAVRGAAFAVPGGVGFQEGGYAALCALFGVPAGAGIALSLLKRVADLVLGLPFIAAWQVLEGRRALQRPRPGMAETGG